MLGVRQASIELPCSTCPSNQSNLRYETRASGGTSAGGFFLGASRSIYYYEKSAAKFPRKLRVLG